MQHIKIYLPCNFEVNPITHFDRLCKLEKWGDEILKKSVPKFELYKHNDELFNMYFWIFYELWNFVDFDRLCKLEKKGG